MFPKIDFFHRGNAKNARRTINYKEMHSIQIIDIVTQGGNEDEMAMGGRVSAVECHGGSSV